ncbi:hypothetical protein Trydic_g16406 [Trypoxylus dichotomus]
MFLDLSKAFDLFDHSVHLSSPWRMGFRDIVEIVLKMVKIGKKSTSEPPFLLCIRDLSNAPQYCIYLFASDTSIFITSTIDKILKRKL